MNSDQPSRNLLLQALPTEEFEVLRPRLELVELTKDAVLVEAGAALSHVYLPLSGVISMVVRLSEGQTVEVAMVGRDSLFGASAALDGGISLTDAVVVLPGTAAILNVADFRAAAERSAALRALLARHEQALFAQAQQSAACNASHTVEARLSRCLLRVRDLCDSETLPLTQEFLAQMIGVQRNAVSNRSGRHWPPLRTRFPPRRAKCNLQTCRGKFAQAEQGSDRRQALPCLAEPMRKTWLEASRRWSLFMIHATRR